MATQIILAVLVVLMMDGNAAAGEQQRWAARDGAGLVTANTGACRTSHLT